MSQANKPETEESQQHSSQENASLTDKDQNSATAKRLLSYVKAFKWVAFAGVLGMLGSAGMDAMFVKLMQPFIDEGLTAQNQQVLYYAPLVVILLVIGRGIFTFIGAYALSYVGTQVVKVLRQQLFEKLLSVPVKFHDQHSSGELISKITFDTEQIQNAVSRSILVLVREGAFVLGLLVVMFWNNWQLSLIFLLVTPIVAIIVSLVSKRFRKISARIQDAMGDVTRCSEQMVKGHKVILSFGGQDIEKTRFEKVNNQNRIQRVKMESTRAMSVGVIQVIAASAIAFVLYAVSRPEMADQISPGAFMSLISAMVLLLRPLKQLANVNGELQRGLTAAKSVFDVLDEIQENDHGTHTVKRVNGNIELKDVTFSYPTSEEPVLKGLSGTISAGKQVALVGRSGSGKSTLSTLLPRFYDQLDSGQITLDNLPIQEYQLSSLREQFALVSQQVMLFNDTIANNICYGCKQPVPQERLEQVAKLAHVWEFAKELPQGLNTEIGDDGVMLSGGQRQRIAIARAILKDAPILILDEATSALDTESERLIQHALDTLMKGRTSIVIAHRLSTIEQADEIWVMDRGRIAEQGTHQQLLEAQGIYHALNKMQQGEST